MFCFLFSFSADAPPTNQDKKVSKDNFSISFKNSVRTHIFNKTCTTKLAHYDTRTPLFCIRLLMSFWMKDTQAFLFCLRLQKSRLLVQKSFWIKDRTKFLQKQCTKCAAFADDDMSFLEQLMSGRSFVSLVSCILPPPPLFRAVTCYRPLCLQSRHM